ncbi:MAG: hypothetical protein QGG39_19055, partial [Candidatus Poribacteria bacterium]|nr:hypothetical protein [Candidatus Poribacteria bacterium]
MADSSSGTIPHQVVDSTITVSDALPGDVNGDGAVNIFDLVIAAGQFGKTGADLMGDVNGDQSVNIFDLVMVASNFGQAAAPAILSQPVATFALVESWIQQAAKMDDGSLAFDQGMATLQAILESLKPDQTVLMANYPNPFNPETWIPFELSQDSQVSLTIYNAAGTPVRSLSLGHLAAGSYVS